MSASEWSRDELAAGCDELGLSALDRADVLSTRSDDGSASRSLLARVGRIGRTVMQRRATPALLLGNSDPLKGYTPARNPAQERRWVPEEPRMHRDWRQPDPPQLSVAEVDELLRLLTPLNVCCRYCNKWQEVPTALGPLREARSAWLDNLQDRAMKAWAMHPAVQLDALRRQEEAQAQMAEIREHNERAAQQQAKADRLFRKLIALDGLSVDEARQIVIREFGGDW
jgi:hypothetical protein